MSVVSVHCFTLRKSKALLTAQSAQALNDVGRSAGLSLSRHLGNLKAYSDMDYGLVFLIVIVVDRPSKKNGS